MGCCCILCAKMLGKSYGDNESLRNKPLHKVGAKHDKKILTKTLRMLSDVVTIIQRKIKNEVWFYRRLVDVRQVQPLRVVLYFLCFPQTFNNRCHFVPLLFQWSKGNDFCTEQFHLKRDKRSNEQYSSAYFSFQLFKVKLREESGIEF